MQMDNGNPNKLIQRAIGQAFDDITTAVSGIDIGSLPNVPIVDVYVKRTLPLSTSAVYFVTHPEEGVLYIGKANDLRARWRCDGRSGIDRVTPEMDGTWVELSSGERGLVEYDAEHPHGFAVWIPTHSCMLRALELGDVSIAWLELPVGQTTATESALLKLQRPPWNTHGG